MSLFTRPAKVAAPRRHQLLVLVSSVCIAVLLISSSLDYRHYRKGSAPSVTPHDRTTADTPVWWFAPFFDRSSRYIYEVLNYPRSQPPQSRQIALHSLPIRFWHRGCHPRIGSDQVGQLCPASVRWAACGYCMHACVLGITTSPINNTTACMHAWAMGTYAPAIFHVTGRRQ